MPGRVARIASATASAPILPLHLVGRLHPTQLIEEGAQVGRRQLGLGEPDPLDRLGVRLLVRQDGMIQRLGGENLGLEPCVVHIVRG
jgi:hypothetical protein